MTSSSAAAHSSSLSPHAAPFTLPTRPICPPGRLQNGDVSRSMDDSFMIYGEDGNSGNACLLSQTTSFATESCNTACPTSTHEMHKSQLNSWSGTPIDFYLSTTCSTSGIVFASSATATSTYNQQNSLTLGHLKGNNGSKYTSLKTDSLAKKTTKTNTSNCSIMSKLYVTENAKSDKDTENLRNLGAGNLVDRKETSEDLLLFSEEANPVFKMKPIHVPTMCAPSCSSVADDVKPDPSECSVDSPCWKGAPDSHQSSFDVIQASAPQPIAQESKALGASGAGQKQGSSTIQYHKAPAEPQNVVTNKNKQNKFPTQAELCIAKESGDNTIHAKDSHGKGLELAKHVTAKHGAEQKWCLGSRDNCMKQSALNSAAPDFVPSSIGKSKPDKGPCSTTGRNISGVLKAMQSLSEVLLNSCSDDEIKLEEHDHRLLELVIENLQTCLHKIRKGPVKGASDKAGPKAPHSQTLVSNSDVKNINSSYAADGGKGIIVSDFAGSSNAFNSFGKVDSLTRAQPSVNNFPKRISYEEENSLVLVYKDLWADAERTNCELKYQLKHARVKVDLESSKGQIGGPRNTSFQVYDLSTDPSSSNGTVLGCPPMLSFLKDHSTIEEASIVRNSQNPSIHSGVRDVSPCSSSIECYGTLPKNLHGDHALVGLEESGMHWHAQRGLQIAPNRACRELNASTSDGMPVHQYIAGKNGNMLSGCDYGSSDWEHVLREELKWS